jgi:hypothetical protein
MVTVKQQEAQQSRQLELRAEKLQFENDLYDDEENEIAADDDVMFLFNWTLLKLTLSSIVSWPVEFCSFCFKMNTRTRDMYTSLATDDSDLVDDGNDISFNSK